MQILGETAKGSARSTGNFNLVEGLRAVSDNFIKFGGHFFAAGYTLNTNQIDQLRQDLNAYYREVEGKLGEAPPLKSPEAQLEGFGRADWQLYGALEQLEPYGNGNPQPIF